MHINLLVKTLDHKNDLSSETDLTVLIVKVTTSKIKPKPWICIHIIHSCKLVLLHIWYYTLYYIQYLSLRLCLKRSNQPFVLHHADYDAPDLCMIRICVFKVICIVLVQLFQACKTKSHLLQWGNTEIKWLPTSHLNYIFQISKKIRHELSHKCCFLCSNSINRVYFRLVPLIHTCNHKSQNTATVGNWSI